MTIYAVYESEPAGASPVIVPERFSWFAALLPFAYAPRHRLWLEFTLVFFGMLLLWMQSRWIGIEAAVWIYIVVAIYFGFEAPTARGRNLLDHGYVRRADIVAGGPDLAELEFRRLGLEFVTGTVAIIDYGSGNLHSAGKAFERAAAGLDVPPRILVTADADTVRAADRIVLPGVGAFADCRAGLDAVPGMVEALDERVIGGGVPFLGICVGMQLMAGEGREKTITPGLGWIAGAVVEITPAGGLKVPHMGWNTLRLNRPHALLEGIETGPEGLHAYFVHSYHLAASDLQSVIATTDYGMEVTAVVGRDNLAGTQFHPEKSQALGLALIGNFLRWRP